MTDIDLQQPNGLSHFGDLIGLEFIKLEDGVSQCQLEVKESHLNPHRMVHGGVIYSLADTGMGGALFSSLDPGQRCATLEIKISYFHFVTSGILSCASKVTGTFAILGGTKDRAG